jgi:hypothetical protein
VSDVASPRDGWNLDLADAFLASPSRYLPSLFCRSSESSSGVTIPSSSAAKKIPRTGRQLQPPSSLPSSSMPYVCPPRVSDGCHSMNERICGRKWLTFVAPGLPRFLRLPGPVAYTREPERRDRTIEGKYHGFGIAEHGVTVSWNVRMAFPRPGRALYHGVLDHWALWMVGDSSGADSCCISFPPLPGAA